MKRGTTHLAARGAVRSRSYSQWEDLGDLVRDFEDGPVAELIQEFFQDQYFNTLKHGMSPGTPPEVTLMDKGQAEAYQRATMIVRELHATIRREKRRLETPKGQEGEKDA